MVVCQPGAPPPRSGFPLTSRYRVLSLRVQEAGERFLYDEARAAPSTNLMDRWIVSFTQSLLLFVKQVTDAPTTQ